jgi:hypothetical protein
MQAQAPKYMEKRTAFKVAYAQLCDEFSMEHIIVRQPCTTLGFEVALLDMLTDEKRRDLKNNHGVVMLSDYFSK